MVDDFTPDFSYVGTYGLVSNKHSILQQSGDKYSISINNRLYTYSCDTDELISTSGTTDHSISSFYSDDNWTILGCEKGIVEICQLNLILRLNKKKVTAIAVSENILYSGSSDGGICVYDLDLHKEEYISTGSSIVSIEVSSDQTYIFVACGDKTVKKFNRSSRVLVDIQEVSDFIQSVCLRENEMFILCKNGVSYLWNLEENQLKTFQQYKKARTIGICGNGDDLSFYVLCAGKLFLYQMNKNDTFGLKHSITLEIDKSIQIVIKHDKKFVGITNKNRIIVLDEKKVHKNYSEYHEGEIITIETLDDNVDGTNTLRVASFSADSLIVWSVDDSGISLINRVNLMGAKCLLVHSGIIYIALNGKIEGYDSNTLNLTKSVSVECTAFASFNDIIAVCYKETVTFYTDGFDTKLREYLLPDSSVFCAFSLGGLFTVSCLDGKVYVYEGYNLTPTADNSNQDDFRQKFCLYGHSLPVRHIDFSPDGKLIGTCGSDKLIKIWGLDFGECRKTIIGDSQNIQYISNNNSMKVAFTDDLWFYSDNSIRYNKKFENLRTLRAFNRGFIKYTGEYLIFSENQGLSLYKMNEEEYLPEENKLLEKMIYKEVFISNISHYDNFVRILESKNSHNDMFEFLERIEFTEIDQLLCVLESENVEYMVEMIQKVIKNKLSGENDDLSAVIFCTRLLKCLFKHHKFILDRMEEFSEITSVLRLKMRKVLDIVCYNDAELKIEMNGVYYTE